MAIESKTLNVQVPAEALARLEALAIQTEQNVADLVAEALAAYLEHQDWMAKEIAQAVAEADAGGPFIEHGEVAAWIRSLGTENELPRPRPK